MSTVAVVGAGSPQREQPTISPINGDEDRSSSHSPVSPESSKGLPAPVSSAPSSSSGPVELPPQTAVIAEPGPDPVSSAGATGGIIDGPPPNIPAARAPPNQPVINSRAGIVSMSKIGGGAHNPSHGSWSPNSYSRPQSMRYVGGDDTSTASYTFQNRHYGGHQGGGDSLSKTNLYIRGLSPNTTDSDLHTMCLSFGKIKSTKAIIDQANNKCKGYGFVDFENASDAERATQHLQQAGIQAQMAKVRENSAQDQDPTNLYIANLPDYVDEAVLEGMVCQYGTVVSVRVLRDSTGKSRNVGFCRMESKEICERIIGEMNKKTLYAGMEPLLVKFADSGNRRKREYRNQHALMGYEGMQTGPMGGQMVAPGMSQRYSMQQVTNQSSYMPAAAAAGSWPGMPMYPQVALSPVNPVTSMQSNIMDPNTTLLATQLSQMQLAPAPAANYGMQQSQPAYPQMYQGQGMVPQQFQYEMSASPPNHMSHVGLEEHGYQGFPQM